MVQISHISNPKNHGNSSLSACSTCLPWSRYTLYAHHPTAGNPCIMATDSYGVMTVPQSWYLIQRLNHTAWWLQSLWKVYESVWVRQLGWWFPMEKKWSKCSKQSSSLHIHQKISSVSHEIHLFHWFNPTQLTMAHILLKWNGTWWARRTVLAPVTNWFANPIHYSYRML